MAFDLLAVCPNFKNSFGRSICALQPKSAAAAAPRIEEEKNENRILWEETKRTLPWGTHCLAQFLDFIFSFFQCDFLNYYHWTFFIKSQTLNRDTENTIWAFKSDCKCLTRLGFWRFFKIFIKILNMKTGWNQGRLTERVHEINGLL